MKRLKLLDMGGQVAVLLTVLVYIALPANNGDFIYLYTAIGSWQLGSFFIHLLSDAGWLNRKDRSLYGKIVLWAVITGLLFYMLVEVAPVFIFFYLFGLLILSPVLAIWYFIIGITEWQTIKRKELIHLK